MIINEAEEIRRSVARCAIPEVELFGLWYVMLYRDLKEPEEESYIFGNSYNRTMKQGGKQQLFIRCVQREEFA